jgi:hypothetical protein
MASVTNGTTLNKFKDDKMNRIPKFACKETPRL